MQNFAALFGDNSTLPEYLTQVMSALRFFRLSDALDILLVTFLLYQLIKLLRDTRAVQLAKGILLIAAVYGATVAMKMNVSGFFFGRVWDSAIVVIFLIFQPEIRHAVESMGRTPRSGLLRMFSRRSVQDQQRKTARRAAIAAAKAAANMSEQKIGALMVFERQTLLGDVAQTGTLIEARLSAQLLSNIFYPKAPLHDGAVIIRGEVLYAAGCVLPLTENQSLPGSYGMRHRAALGISEQSDAVVLVVSEETGNISLARGGTLQTELTESLLREELTSALDWNSNENPDLGGYAARRWREFWSAN
ncbi:MAG: diadenylate cyclase CdaA [Oscillospiraceae bacterium]|jgi:diadenylate cyclase|nr:diadenylate cyclase CdaA [Oscillospiraceae bacterium]